MVWLQHFDCSTFILALKLMFHLMLVIDFVQIGDGSDGGGVVLHGVPWGERALSIAHEALKQFGDNVKLFSFKTTPRGYVYVRLDKLLNE